MNYTKEMLAFLNENYPVLGQVDLTLKFNQKFHTQKSKIAICGACKRHGIKSGRTGYFAKNHVPFNKGTKGFNKPNRTSFTNGHVPVNFKPVGSERINVDGYIEIKVRNPNKWQFKHRVIWTTIHGEIPKGMAVCFLDSNPLNCVIENLKLISMRENALFNKRGFCAYPDELKPILRNIAAVEVTSRKVREK